MLCLLGPPATTTGDGLHPLDLRPRALGLLAHLALAEEPQPRSRLADLLFPHATNPRDSLRWYLSYLRRQLPGALVFDGSNVSARIETDVRLFREGTARILEGCSLTEATPTLALYRGDLCAGLVLGASADFDNWLYVQEDELRRLFRRATQAFANRALAEGRAALAVPALQQLTAVDPYYEEGHVLLVHVNEASSDTAGARHAYDRYQRIVRSELHAEPRRDLVVRYEPERPAGRELPLDELVPLHDVTMHVLDWPGQEPALLIVHGSSGQGAVFTAWGETLSPELRVIAVDLRGHGLSDKPPSGYGVDDHVRDLLQLIEALALERPVMLGHSLGGSIATFVAEAVGDALGGLVLLDAVVGDQTFTESASLVLKAHYPSLEQRFTSFDEYLSFWAAEDDGSQWTRWLGRNSRMELAPLPDGTLRRRALHDALAAEWASVAQRDALTALSHVTVPVLVVHADAPWTLRAAAEQRWATEPYIDQATIDAQVGAARDPRFYRSHGQHHSELVVRPSAGLIEAVRAFAKEIRTSEGQKSPT